MTQTGGDRHAGNHAHHHSQHKAQHIEADNLAVGVANQHVGQQRCQTGGKQHGIDVGHGLILFDQVGHDDTQHGKPHIQQVDAPGAEAQCQQEGQSGHIIDHSLGQGVKQSHSQSHQTHVQEGSCIAANGEIVGGDLTGTGENVYKTGEHGCPVRHAHSRNHAGCCDKSEEQLQKTAFGKIFDLIHTYLILL